MLCLSKCSYQVKLFQFQFNFLYFSFQHKQEIIENNDVTIHQANCLQSLYFGIRQMMKALNCISLRVVLDVDNDMYVNGHLNDCSVLDKVWGHLVLLSIRFALRMKTLPLISALLLKNIYISGLSSLSLCHSVLVHSLNLISLQKANLSNYIYFFKVDIACNLREAIQAVNEFLGAFETEQNGMIKEKHLMS
ncbi:uncharacterized protein LOC144571306 isoform X2 [Carex rostrata]